MVSTNISVMLFRCVYVCWRVVHMFVHVCCVTGWTQTVVQLRSFKVAFRAPGSESRKSRNLRDFFEICLGIFEDSKSHGMSYEISFHCKLCYSAIWSYDDVISNDLVSLIWWLRWFQIRGVSMCFILHFGKAFSLLKFHIRPCVAPSLDLCKYDVAWLALRMPCLLIPCYTFCSTMMMMFFFFFGSLLRPKVPWRRFRGRVTFEVSDCLSVSPGATCVIACAGNYAGKLTTQTAHSHEPRSAKFRQSARDWKVVWSRKQLSTSEKFGFPSDFLKFRVVWGQWKLVVHQAWGCDGRWSIWHGQIHAETWEKT